MPLFPEFCGVLPTGSSSLADLCSTCGKFPRIENRQQCERCTLQSRAYNRKYREQNKQRYRERRKARAAAGLCAVCGVGKPLAGKRQCERCRGIHRAYNQKYRDAHRAEHRESTRRQYAKHAEHNRARGREWRRQRKLIGGEAYLRECREKCRKSELKWRYGITVEEYNLLFSMQRGLCLGCGLPGKNRRLDVDHDHKTKVVRGLLCVCYG
jgi:hypothetical protein